MAETQPMTLQQRIASLNASHIGRVPGDPPLIRPKPQIPLKRPVVIRQKTVNNPPEQTNGSVAHTRIGNEPARDPLPKNILPPPVSMRENPRATIPSKTPPPPLPKRQPSRPPPLPDRRDSSENSRRGSGDSGVSHHTANTHNDEMRLSRARSKSSDRVKAPAWGEEQLPPLPVKGAATAPRKFSAERPKYINRAPTCDETVMPSVTLASRATNGDRPSLPPRLPSRKSDSGVTPEQSVPKVIQQNYVGGKIPPLPTEAINKIQKAALSFGSHKLPMPSVVAEPSVNAAQVVQAHPPPVPISSRPDLTALQATKPKSSTSLATTNGHADQSRTCMVCRDFSAPDHHASLFPRQQVTSLPNLAQQLTAPFLSHTDKARAIFTWLHHNISYDVVSFFNNNVRGSTPQSTLQTGLAVCEGYAALFANLATHAGLESIVVSGHGKGFGYHSLPPGAPIPPFEMGHAWNAARIDNNEWKLIDPCWGAGHVKGKGQPYVAKFNDTMFTMTNEEFSIKHFPSNKEHFFLPNGARMSWEEYIMINPAYWPSQIEPPTIFTNAKDDYGIGERTVMPRNRNLKPSDGGNIRFLFGLRCPHWTLEHTKKGLPPVFMVAVHGIDGRNKDHIPLEHVRGQPAGAGGDLWYVDIPAKELGAPGQTVTLFAVTSFGNRNEARGLTVKEFKEGKGRVGMGFMGVAAWDLI